MHRFAISRVQSIQDCVFDRNVAFDLDTALGEGPMRQTGRRFVPGTAGRACYAWTHRSTLGVPIGHLTLQEEAPCEQSPAMRNIAVMPSGTVKNAPGGRSRNRIVMRGQMAVDAQRSQADPAADQSVRNEKHDAAPNSALSATAMSLLP